MKLARNFKSNASTYLAILAEQWGRILRWVANASCFFSKVFFFLNLNAVIHCLFCCRINPIYCFSGNTHTHTFQSNEHEAQQRIARHINVNETKNQTLFRFAVSIFISISIIFFDGI